MSEINYELVLKTKKFRDDIAFYYSWELNRPFICPDVLQLTVTTRCNLRCKTCNIYKHSSKPEEELSVSEMKSLITQAYLWGISTLSIVGGEPFLRSEIFPVIEYAKKFGMEVQITTNGTLMMKELADKIVELNVDNVLISLDGSTPELHDAIRGVNGTFSRAVSGIKSLVHAKEEKKSAKPLVTLSFTLENKNCDDIANFESFAKKLGVNNINYMPYVQDISNMRVKLESDPLWIPPKKINKLKEDLKRIEIFNADRFVYRPKSFYLISKYFERKLDAEDWKCFVGFMRFNVAPDGNVMMCGDIIGNVREEKNIISLWNSKKAQRARINAANCSNPCLQDCISRPYSESIVKIVESIVDYTKSLSAEDATSLVTFIVEDLVKYRKLVLKHIKKIRNVITVQKEQKKHLIHLLIETQCAINKLLNEGKRYSYFSMYPFLSEKLKDLDEMTKTLKRNERELLELKKSRGYRFLIKPFLNL